MKKRKKNIIPQMFDVRPQDLAGDFDVKKLKEKYNPIVKLGKSSVASVSKKRSPIIMPPKWDISSGNIAERKDQKVAEKDEVIQKLSRDSLGAKNLQLNQLDSRVNFKEFVSLDNKKFLGASKPFLNKSFDYQQEFFGKKKMLREDSAGSLSQRIQKWQEDKNKEKQRKEDRLAKRQARRNFIEQEGRVKLEKIQREKDRLRKLQLAEEIRIKEDRTERRRQRKMKLAIKRDERRRRWAEFLSNINIFNTDLSDGISLNKKRQIFGFVTASLFIFIIFWGVKTFSYGIQIQDDVIVKGKSAIGELAYAKDDLENQDFQSAVNKFSNAREDFQEASSQLDNLGGDLLNVFSAMPGLSKISSGKSIVKAGEKMTEAAEELGGLAVIFVGDSETSNQLNANNLRDVFMESNESLLKAHNALEEAQTEIDRVKADDLPEEYQQEFLKVQKIMPSVVGLLEDLEKNYEVLWEILGFRGVRRYLLVFQNNQEMRATGGFIGSYGVLEMNDGKVKNLFIDGIYNPDGQLREKVVPPKPIQKISAAWSTHDANWFPDFPTSAEKIAWFYEKTGGPTVDGVIAVTPTVMEKLLRITGPIEMPEYGTIVDENNFLENTQYEVEVDYDKQENKPKKFLADLAPKVLESLFVEKDMNRLSKTLKVFSESIKEKHILIYSFNYNVQKVVSEQGWSGEVLRTGKDYLMVVNTNINGYKTDGVVDEFIDHKAEIQADGSIVNTVRIKRIHKGGNYDYEWWNKVNSDYMRIYVPKGSQLLSVEGHTREFNNPPLDYDKLEFRRDPQVESEERSMDIDEATGTRIYEEENKTVFANWVYVSPQETVEVEYKYILPFRVDLSRSEDAMDSYSILVQKQSGSVGSEFSSEISFPSEMKVFWRYPEVLSANGNSLSFEQALVKDIFVGVVLKEEDGL